MSPQSQAQKPRWGQARRLAFIDLRLQYDGRINRRDLIAFFEISTPQASADLALYQSLAPQNLEYDPRARVYVALDTFCPLFGRTAATRYLDEINRLARGVIELDESFVGFVPPTGIVATPARAIESVEVATIVRAIRDGVALRVQYQSMDQPEPQRLLLSPHAMGFDGLRCHIRAWCHARRMFRDFAIGRLKIEEVVAEAEAVDSEEDRGWTTHVAVVLVPHPKLSPRQREVVMHDYNMSDGRLVLNCRKAMLFYTLRHLNLEALSVTDNPAHQHVVIANTNEVAQWIEEDRRGNVLPG